MKRDYVRQSVSQSLRVCVCVAAILFGTTRKLSIGLTRTLASITSHTVRRSHAQSSPPPIFPTKWSREEPSGRVPSTFCLFSVRLCHVSLDRYRPPSNKTTTTNFKSCCTHRNSPICVILTLVFVFLFFPFILIFT